MRGALELHRGGSGRYEAAEGKGQKNNRDIGGGSNSDSGERRQMKGVRWNNGGKRGF